MTKTKLVIADSHEIVREGLAHKLEKECGYEIVGQAEDGYSALKACRLFKPDILVMGMSLTRPSGMETLVRVRSLSEDIRIVVMASDTCAIDAFSAISEGAISFVPRDAKVINLINAVRCAESGYACIPQEYIQEFTQLRRNVKRTGNIYGLSPREIEVLEASASGAKTKEVAGLLDISVRTVETHRNSIYRKTDCRNMAELVSILLEN